MTINLADNNPRIAYSVAQGVTQTTFAVPFEFFEDADVKVYLNGELRTQGAHYTISGGSGSTGTVTMSVTGVTGGSTVVLVRRIVIERTTDFQQGIDINRPALNEQLDVLTGLVADMNDRLDRSLHIEDFEVGATDLALPSIPNRANGVLIFDTEGNPAIGFTDDLPSGLIIGQNYIVNTSVGNGSTTVFTLTADPVVKSNVQVHIDGVYQNKASFSLSGTTLTFSEAPPLNASIEFIIGVAIPVGIETSAAVVSYTQGGSGAVSRTVQSRLRDFVSVKDFGAVGDGVTDDTSAFNAAWAAAAPQAVYVPAASYAITGTVTGKFFSFGAVTVVGGTVTTITNLVP
jgi:hypothetical protein